MRGHNRAAWGLPLWVAMTDDDRGPTADDTFRALPPGSALIVRGRSGGRARETAEAIVEHRRVEDVLVLAALSAPSGKMLAIDGIHIPEVAVRQWRRYQIQRLRPGLLTVSAHGRIAVWRAKQLGADAALLSSVFATPSHPGGKYLGLHRFARLAKDAPLPIYALGGIQRGQIRRVLGTAAIGIAGIGLFADSAGLR